MTYGRDGIIVEAGAFLRRDAGFAAFVTNSRRVGLPDGWLAAREGALTRIYPTDSAILACDYAPDELARTLRRFSEAPVTGEARKLFCEAVKMLEAPNHARACLLEKKLRQAAAAALRDKNGGGLYQCALALAEIKRRNKYED